MTDAPRPAAPDGPSPAARWRSVFSWLVVAASVGACTAFALGSVFSCGSTTAAAARDGGVADEDGGAIEEDGGGAGDDGGAAAPDGGTQPPPLLTTPVDRLYIQPRDDNTFLASAISAANRSVDCVFYILTDNTIEDRLIAAKRRGLTVRVLFDKDQSSTSGVNRDAKTKFTAAGVLWKNGPARFANVHQKTVVIDSGSSSAKAYVMTLNPSASGFNDNREYAAMITRAAEITDLNRLFDADWNNGNEPTLDSALVVSNTTARDRITRLVRKAQRDVLATLEVFTDQGMRTVLAERKAAGVRIRVLLADPRDVMNNADNAAVLKSFGFEVKFLHNPVMHAKLMVVDGTLAYVGSVNMTPTSMNGNREVGLIIDQASIVNQLKTQAEADWTAATPVP